MKLVGDDHIFECDGALNVQFGDGGFGIGTRRDGKGLKKVFPFVLIDFEVEWECVFGGDWEERGV